MNVVSILTKNGRPSKQSPEAERKVFATKLALAIKRESSFNVNTFLYGVLCLPMLLLPLIIANASGMNTGLFLDLVWSIIFVFHTLLLVAIYADTLFCLRAHCAVFSANENLMKQIEASRGDLWRQVDEERQCEVSLRLAA